MPSCSTIGLSCWSLAYDAATPVRLAPGRRLWNGMTSLWRHSRPGLWDCGSGPLRLGSFGQQVKESVRPERSTVENRGPERRTVAFRFGTRLRRCGRLFR